MFAEEGEVEVLVDLVDVSLHSDEDETERVLLSESSTHDGLELTELTAEGPALSEGGVNSPGGDTHTCEELGQGQRHQQHEGGDWQHPDSSQSVSQSVSSTERERVRERDLTWCWSPH